MLINLKQLNLNSKIWYANQNQVRNYFVKRLVDTGRDFELVDGNIVCLDRPKVPCLVAHMDTVNDRHMIKQIYYDKKKDVIFRNKAILGADDKAGVQIIDDYFDQANFILTRDEETGLQGARSLSTMDHISQLMDTQEVPCLLEFDRMNHGDIVGEFNDYCLETLAEDISEISNGDYVTALGVCTDLDELNQLGVEGVNLSVGYYSQHSTNETLNITQFERARKLAGELLEGLYGKMYRFEGMSPKKDHWGWDEVDDDTIYDERDFNMYEALERMNQHDYKERF